MKLTEKVANHFIDDLNQAWKKFSVLMFVFITALPDAYQLAQTAGLLDFEQVPDNFKWLVRGLGILGLYLRLVKQQAKQALADDKDVDQKA
jgi:hypothetical protein